MANRDNVFMLDITDEDGGALHVTTPASVLMIHSAEELTERLNAYSDPIKNRVVKNTPKARRWYVEKILPALRFYCDRYGVDQPDWLATNGSELGVTDPMGPTEGGRRVLRGGSWATRSRLMRCSLRNFFQPCRRDIMAGFRTCAQEGSGA